MLKIAIICGTAALSAVGAAEAVMSLQRAQLAPPQAAVAMAPAPAVAAEAAPSHQGGDASITKSADGHFWAQGQVNGSALRFLVDTGATAVSLTPEDARRLGFALDHLTYGYKVITASGEARAAKVQLESVSVGGARVEGVEAYVIESGLSDSLLGMSFLGRLSRFEATQNALILRS